MATVRSAALFCVKSAIFSAVFWGMWLGIIRPITTAPQNNGAGAQDSQTNAQVQAYEEQMNRTNRMLDISEDQQKRMDQYLTSQEENARRFDAVLKAWEKQTGPRK